MVRDNRIKEYRFSQADLTPVGAHLDIYTDRPLNGTLQAIEWIAGNHAATGSLTIYSSGGTGTQIWGLVSGTAKHMVAENFVVFPKASTVSTTDVSLSGTANSWYADIPLNGVLHVIGSSFGASKSGLGCNITYI